MLNKKSAEEKLAVFLINLSTRFKRLGYSSKKYNLPMSRQEIGNYLGLTTETVSRTFSKFKKLDLLTVNHKALLIKDLDSLHAIADG
jgi:CRP/FNR family transcriptional regulator